jgi:DoxX-like family
MDISTDPPSIASGYGSARWRSASYWLATVAVAGELGLGGIWDIARIPYVRDLVAHLGYPSYFLVLLGSWKVLGAVALLVPRRALLKEWAYAGAFFTYTGAIVSHLTTGYDLGEVGLLTALTALTALSWALRPPSRRTPRPMSTAPPAAAVPDTQGAAPTTLVTGHGAAGTGEAATGTDAPSKQR